MNDESNRKTLKQRTFLKSLICCVCVFSMPSFAAYNDYLQVGVFHQSKNAKQMLAYIKQLNSYPMAIKQSVLNTKITYTVIIEGFKNKTVAQKLQSFLKTKGYKCLLKRPGKNLRLFKFMPTPAVEEAIVSHAYQELTKAKKNPEYMLTHELYMPVSPDVPHSKSVALSMRDAILLSLRYSSDIQSTELDRITARYQLRIKQNDFELQYAMTGSNQFSWSRTLGQNQPMTQSWALDPSVSLKSKWGGVTKVAMANGFDGKDYSPQVTLSFAQPLLRGAGPSVVEQGLNDQYDKEIINILSIKQSYIDKVTAVITAYRSLIQQHNTYLTQKKSLKDAKYTFWVNKKRIEAGALEPTGNIQQEYQVSNLSVTLESQLNTLTQAKRSLLQLIGLDPKLAITVPSDTSIGRMVMPNMKKTVNNALNQNISYMNALINYKITKRAYNTAQNDQLWQLNLAASKTYGSASGTGQDRNFSNITNGRNQGSQVGLNLNVPINDLARRSTLISAKVSLEQSRLKLIAQRRQLQTDVINKVVNIKTQVSLYNMNVKQLSLAQRSYDIEIKKRTAGISSSIDVTNTQNQLINAKNSLIGSKISYLEGMSSLQQLLGTTLDVWQIKMGFM